MDMHGCMGVCGHLLHLERFEAKLECLHILHTRKRALQKGGERKTKNQCIFEDLFTHTQTQKDTEAQRHTHLPTLALLSVPLPGV